MLALGNLRRFYIRSIFISCLAVAVVASLFIFKHLNYSKATVKPEVKAASSILPDKSAQYQMPVLVLKYFPTTDGVNLDSSITGVTATMAQIRTHVDTIQKDTLTYLEDGSRFHGYKDAGAPVSMHYSIIDNKEFDTALPIGNEVPWKPGQGIYRPDYMKILTDLNICNYVDNQGLKEVWFFGWHYGNIEPVESNMAGPYGDISNSERTNDMPVCSKTYVLYNYNYGRATDQALHDHGHQIESVLSYIDPTTFVSKFIGPWSTYSTNDGSGANFHRCGWTHNPPNTGTEYDYYNTQSSGTDCEDWNPGGTGVQVNVTCSEWQCSESKFHDWRWQNMPGMNNPNPELSNWWDFIGDFDKAMAAGEKLYYPTPTPTPTPRPTLDTDGDGFTDFVEGYMGTDANLACGVNAWPPDLNNDGVVDSLDTTLIQGRYLTKVGDANYEKRYDLNADGLINTLDLALVGKYYGKSCAQPSPSPTPPIVGGGPSALTAASTCNGSMPVITFKWQDDSNFESGFWLDVSSDAFNGPSNTSASPSVWGVKGIYRGPAETTATGLPVQFAWDSEASGLTAGPLDSGDSDPRTSGRQITPQAGLTYYWRVKAFNFTQGSNHVYPGTASPPGQSVTAVSCP